MERILDKDLVSVQSYIDKFCGIYAESPFMRVNTPDGIRNVLYASLKTDTYALANAFLKHGYTGKHIALISENRYEFFVVFFASLMAGVTFIPINYAADPQKIADMLSFADTDILCATAKTAPLADAAANLCGRDLIRISLDDCEGSIAYASLIEQGRGLEAQSYYGRFDSDETVLLCFTSGTSSAIGVGSTWKIITHGTWKGTVTVESAVMGLPLVAGYRFGTLNYLLICPYFHPFRGFIAMPNIITGTRVFPELLQFRFKAENLVPAMESILPGGDKRQAAVDGMKRMTDLLREGGSGRSAEDRAADEIWRV